MLKLSRWVLVIGSVITAALILIYALAPLPVRQAQNAVFDTYQRDSPRTAAPNSIVHVIDIDENSLAALGQWPWPRTYLAEMTNRLYGAGALVVAFDVLLSEADRTSPRAIEESWKRFEGTAILPDTLRDLPDHDVIFADAIASGPTILAIAGSDGDQVAPPLAGISYTGQVPDTALPRFPGALSPLPGLQNAATGIGSVSLAQSTDGVTRSVPMRFGSGTSCTRLSWQKSFAWHKVRGLSCCGPPRRRARYQAARCRQRRCGSDG